MSRWLELLQWKLLHVCEFASYFQLGPSKLSCYELVRSRHSIGRRKQFRMVFDNGIWSLDWIQWYRLWRHVSLEPDQRARHIYKLEQWGTKQLWGKRGLHNLQSVWKPLEWFELRSYSSICLRNGWGHEMELCIFVLELYCGFYLEYTRQSHGQRVLPISHVYNCYHAYVFGKDGQRIHI